MDVTTLDGILTTLLKAMAIVSLIVVTCFMIHLWNMPHPSHPIELPRPDNTLPGDQPYPDQGLPGDQPRPDNTLPGDQPRPDNTLPGDQPRPDNTLPGDQPRPDNTLPGDQPRPDNTLPTPPAQTAWLPAETGSSVVTPVRIEGFVPSNEALWLLDTSTNRPVAYHAINARKK
jgi:hypothetical protein